MNNDVKTGPKRPRVRTPKEKVTPVKTDMPSETLMTYDQLLAYLKRYGERQERGKSMEVEVCEGEKRIFPYTSLPARKQFRLCGYKVRIGDVDVIEYDIRDVELLFQRDKEDKDLFTVKYITTNEIGEGVSRYPDSTYIRHNFDFNTNAEGGVLKHLLNAQVICFDLSLEVEFSLKSGIVSGKAFSPYVYVAGHSKKWRQEGKEPDDDVAKRLLSEIRLVSIFIEVKTPGTGKFFNYAKDVKPDENGFIYV